ncbi:unnamed protein product [Ambrosiozyma monospora]|uniref:Unnamed protein product n=1 Tax=Ambrosiozyma monospora TaxID=43982 RepID=A0ACB5T3C6_AMBMO|nr:unnamed protein product [Ambrosiozyma monospora]
MNIPEQSLYNLRPTIIYCLDHDLLPTAEFTAERLLAQNANNTDSIYIYALTLFKQQKYKSVYNATSPYATEHVGCSYLFAKACLELNMEADGTKALTKTSQLWTNLGGFSLAGNNNINNINANGNNNGGGSASSSSTTGELYERYQPDAIACCMLLAKLYAKTGDVQRSAVYYAEVLKMNPYMFEAFESLCKMGVKVKVNSIYKVNQMNDINNPLFKTSQDDKKSGFGFGFGELKKPSDQQQHQQQQQQQQQQQKSNVTTPARSNTLGTISGSPDPQMSSNNFLLTPRLKQASMPEAPLRRATRNSGYDGFKQPSLPTDSIIRKKNRIHHLHKAQRKNQEVSRE